jgi:hypothetical protein
MSCRAAWVLVFRAAPRGSAAKIATAGVPWPPMGASSSSSSGVVGGVQAAPLGGVAELASLRDAGLGLAVLDEGQDPVGVQVVDLDREPAGVCLDHGSSQAPATDSQGPGSLVFRGSGEIR